MIGVFGGGIYGLYAYAQATEEFRVTTMHVRGLDWVAEQDIMAASQVTTDDNLLFLNRSLVAQRVSELPGIESAGVEKMFPDTLLIEVKERKPFVSLVVRNNVYAVDRSGVVIRAEPRAGNHVGPLLTEVADISILELGDRIEDAAFREAMDVWDAFRTTAMAEQVAVSEIAAVATNDIRMYCVDLPFELRWGRGDYERQARRLDILWQERGDDLGCSEYLDLRFGEQVACR